MDRVWTREWACGFCLGVTETTNGGPPGKCKHCDVTRCTNCSTALKGVPFLCYGCGIVFPKTVVRMSSTDSFGCHYMHEDWARRNKGPSADGSYAIATSMMPETRGQHRVIKYVENEKGERSDEDVRSLTPDESARYSSMCGVWMNAHDDYCI